MLMYFIPASTAKSVIKSASKFSAVNLSANFAYSVGLILIYLLVVGQFRSYAVPLIIMAPIPLTIIGVMPGHALLGAQFTATSMIGMIALAGIVVRNSGGLIDFIHLAEAEGFDHDHKLIVLY